MAVQNGVGPASRLQQHLMGFNGRTMADELPARGLLVSFHTPEGVTLRPPQAP